MFWKKKKTLEEREQEAQQQLANWKRERVILNAEHWIKKDKLNFEEKEPKKRLSTSKILIAFLFINFTVLELFILGVTIASFSLAFATGMPVDFSPLLMLGGAILGETISYLIYTVKSAKENSEGGLVYLKAQQEFEEKQHHDEAVG